MAAAMCHMSMNPRSHLVPGVYCQVHNLLEELGFEWKLHDFVPWECTLSHALFTLVSQSLHLLIFVRWS